MPTVVQSSARALSAKSTNILLGSFTVAARFTVTASSVVAVGVKVMVPVAAPRASGVVISTAFSSLAARVTDAGAVKPPVVAMFTVTLSVPGFFTVMAASTH